MEEGRVVTTTETLAHATSAATTAGGTSNGVSIGDDDATTTSNISFTGDTRTLSSVGHPGFYAGQHPKYKDYAHHPALGSMQNLVHVNARNNNFDGEIPGSTGSLSKLRVLDLSHNDLTGTLPDEIGKAQTLQKIILNNNGLEGTISSDIVSLPRLFQLNLASNSLSGNIPQDIGEMGRGWAEDGQTARQRFIWTVTV